MNSVLKSIGKSICILIVASIVGMILLTLVYLVPLNYDKLQKATDLLYQQNTTGDYPLITAWTQNYFTYRPGVFDGTTAKLIFDYSTRSLSGRSPFQLALMEDYPRYWHGYALFIRPLLAFLDYQDMEIFFSFLLTFLAMMDAAIIGKRKGTAYALGFITSFLLIMPMTVGICTQYILIALIAYGALLVLLRWEEALFEKDRFIYFFLIIGILTSYFDFLTYPIFTWGIPVIWWLLLDKRERSGKNSLSFVVISAIAWAGGYLGMWAGKWLLGSVFLHQNLLMDALQQIQFRSGVQDALSIRERLYVAYKNWKHYSFILYALLLGGWLVVYLINGIRFGWKWNNKAPALCLIAMSSFVWNMGAANHMEVHHYFTYRIYGVAVMAWLAFLLETLPGPEERVRSKFKEKITLFLTLGITAIFAFLATLVTKEETEISNKVHSGYEQILFEGGKLQMSFTPAYKRITGICVALKASNEEGDYVLQLKNGDQLIYEENIPISYLEGMNYKLYPVDWKVVPNQEYQLSIEAPQNSGIFTAYISTEYSGMAELGAAQLNDDMYDGQSCVGVVYWARPFSKYLKVFWLMTWFSIFLVISYFLCQKGRFFLTHFDEEALRRKKFWSRQQ